MRYFIYLSYKGTNYHGWQAQANARTVQDEVNRALSLLLSEKIETTGAGRTDTGVHASYFVAHFDSGQYELYVATNGAAQALYKLNCILPGDVCIHDILPVEATAHARFDATLRTYKYYISMGKNPFNTEFAAFFPFELNVAAMNDAAQLLFEYTDFTSFSKLHGQSKTNHCRIGTLIYSQKSEQFQVKQGPVFANFILADEINRSPAKVQSALLEAMQERKVTIGDKTFKLPEPFLVLATQNPIEQEGTYPLPEAQVDRFMLKVVVSYPRKEEEKLIIRQNISGEFPRATRSLKPEDIIKARGVVRYVYMDEKIERYIVDIVYATRTPEEYGLASLKNLLAYGASPRASISLAMASKAYAFLKHRGYEIPADVRAVCYEVLRHRMGLTYEAEAENITPEDIVTQVLNSVEVP